MDPTQEETTSNTMNVLGDQNQSPQGQDAGQDPQNVSGRQSATVGGSQGAQQQPANQPKKGVGSGMFTNVRKYVQANKPKVQQMSGAVTGKFQQQAGNIRNQFKQQQTDFDRRVNENRQRLLSATQFGQQAVQRASGLEDTQALQQQQEQAQSRLGRLGELQEGGYQQNVQDLQSQMGYQDYVSGWQPPQGAIQTGLEETQQAQEPMSFADWQSKQRGTLQQQQQQALQDLQAQEQAQRDFFANYAQYTPESVTYWKSPTQLSDEERARMASQDIRQIMGLTGDASLQKVKENSQQLFDSYKAQGMTDEQALQQVQGLSQWTSGGTYYDPTTGQYAGTKGDFYRGASELGKLEQDLAAKQAAYQQAAQGLSGFDQQSLALMQAQEQQAQYEHQQEIQAELADLQNRMENAPETLTEDEVSRFRDLITGQTRFDNIAYDTGKQARAAQAMLEKAQRADTEQGRRELLRDALGADRYTSGMTSLDQLLLGSDESTRRQISKATKGTAEALTGDISSAKRAALADVAGLTTKSKALRQQLGTDLESQQEALRAALKQRLETGEGLFETDLQRALQTGALSDAELEILGLEAGAKLYGTDVGSFFQYDPTKESISSIAQASDLARAQALASLAGREQDIITDPSAMGREGKLSGQGGLMRAQRKQNEAAEMARQAEAVRGKNAADVWWWLQGGGAGDYTRFMADDAARNIGDPGFGGRDGRSYVQDVARQSMIETLKRGGDPRYGNEQHATAWSDSVKRGILEEERMKEAFGGTLGGQQSQVRQAEIDLATKKAQEDKMLRDFYNSRMSGDQQFTNTNLFQTLRRLGRG